MPGRNGGAALLFTLRARVVQSVVSIAPPSGHSPIAALTGIDNPAAPQTDSATCTRIARMDRGAREVELQNLRLRLPRLLPGMPPVTSG